MYSYMSDHTHVNKMWHCPSPCCDYVQTHRETAYLNYCMQLQPSPPNHTHTHTHAHVHTHAHAYSHCMEPPNSPPVRNLSCREARSLGPGSLGYSVELGELLTPGACSFHYFWCILAFFRVRSVHHNSNKTVATIQPLP